MLIPWDTLSPAALAGVIEEYVTRDGTDLSDVPAKAARVKNALRTGRLVIVFDPEDQTCNLLPPEAVPPDGADSKTEPRP